MFDIPQKDSDKGEVSVITLEEDSETVEALLLIFTPSKTPEFGTVILFRKIVSAMDKYLIPMEVLKALKLNPYLDTTLLSSHGLELYGLAWRLRLKEELSIASRYTHKEDITARSTIDRILESCGDVEAYRKLVKFRNQRNTAVLRLIGDLGLPAKMCDSHQNCGWALQALVRQVEKAFNVPCPTFPMNAYGLSDFLGLTQAVSGCRSCWINLHASKLDLSCFYKFPDHIDSCF